MKRTLLSIVFLSLMSLYSFSQTWIQEGLGFTATERGIMNVFIVNSQVVWVAAYDGSGSGAAVQDFSKTVNGGTTWTPGTVNNASGQSFSQICAVDANTAWACMYKVSGSNPQGVYYTTDGGTTWVNQPTAVFTSSTSFPDWIYFWDANNGIVVGDPVNNYFQIYTTSNGGTNWVALPTSQMPVVLSGETGYTANYCVLGDFVWFGTSHGRIFASTDRGQHWIAAAPFTTSENAFAAYQDSLNGLGLKYLASTDTLNILKMSTDGGNSYSGFTFYGVPFDGEIHYIPGTPSTYITTGVDYKNQPSRLGLAYSFNEGVNWAPEPTIYGIQLTCSQWLNDSTGWAGSFNTGTTDGIYKFNSVLALPVSDFMSPDTLIALGGQAAFTNLSTGHPTAYAWTFTGGVPSSSTLKNPPAITYNTPGTYNVRLITTNSWGKDTLTKINYIHVGGVGINELNQNSVTVFPNPVKDMMTVQGNSQIKEIEIYSVTGQLLIGQTVNAKKITLSVSGLSAGVYSLKAIMDNGTFIKKIVIQ
jgi:PKD repeat protein